MNLLANYKLLTRNMDATLALAAKRPDVKRESEDYLNRIRNVKSVDDFMNDPRVYNFTLQAYGIKDMAYAKAFIRKILTEGTDNPNSFTMQLADSRFREFAEDFNFSRYGKATTSFDRTQQGTVDRYLRNKVELQAGQQDESLRLALYFKRKAPQISTIYGILADRAVYTVVRMALGLPAAISSSDIDKQAALIGSKIDIKDFADPAKLEKFITRFVATSIASGAGQGAGSNSPAISILQGASWTLGQSTILSLQSLKRFNS